MNDHEIAHAMLTYGGSFVQALGRAFLAADAENRETLRNAYPELVMEYGRIAQMKAEQAAKG